MGDGTQADRFIPRPWLRNPHIQSILSSSRLRAPHPNRALEASTAIVLEGGNGARLLGFHSPQSDRSTKGLFILLHGWEGSADSAYILSAARFFYEAGYDVFRLNLWDHGASHHLNPGLFHGALLDETAGAVHGAAALCPDKPCYILGFSLGGNFALRIALRQSRIPIPTLRHVFCVSPALDPYKATLAIDRSLSIYRAYFVNKWKRSLRKKQALFPDRYDFTAVLKLKTCMAMTEAIMPYYPDFPSYQAYFARYTLLGDAFRDLALPVTVIASADDPVVPVADLQGLGPNPCLEVLQQAWGGHCGFFISSWRDCWYEWKIGRILQQEAGDPDGGKAP